jgi:hypothetical protein
MKLISLHLPKTAGSSFSKSLQDRFGNAFLADYDDAGISKPEYERNERALHSAIEIAKRGLGNVECVHGHFLPIKYLLLGTLEEVKFVTWMRDPVERMISHYNYWQRTYRLDTLPHHKQAIEERWTLEQFCLSPRFRNIYCQYLWAFPFRRFDFIGITEHYENDLAYFSDHYLSGQLERHMLNTAATKTTKSSIDPLLLEKIEAYHKDDMDLYERALHLRQKRQ